MSIHYLGIVIKQSLKDGKIDPPAEILSQKHVNTWDFLLIRVVETALDEHIHTLQSNMVPSDTWYAHYFNEEKLVVVFRDAVFRATINRGSWGQVIDYGLKKGIPAKQLDFDPATEQGARKFFGIENAFAFKGEQ